MLHIYMNVGLIYTVYILQAVSVDRIKLQTPSFLPGCKFGKTQTLPDLEGQEQKPVVSAFTYNSAMSKKLTHGSFTSSVRRSPSHDKG